MSFWPIKLQYVLLYAVIGAWMPYLPVYLDELGMADWQIGWIMGVYGLAVLIMPAIIAAVADRWLSNRVLILLSYSCSAVLLAGIASVDGFWSLLLLSMFFSMAYTPLFALTDGMTFAAIQDAEEAGDHVPPYHHLRIWGSIGFIVPSLALFLVLRYTGATTHAAMVTAAIAASIAVMTSLTLPLTRRAPGTAQKKLPTSQAWSTVVRAPAIHFVGPVFLIFVSVSIFYVFYTIYLGELGIGEEWMGLIVNVGVLAEVLLMLISGRMVHWFGLKGLMVLGAGCMALRLSLLTIVPTIPVAIATQLLHAPVVLSLYLLPPMYLNAKAQRSYRNSMQGVYSALYYGVARLSGSVIGGYAAGDDGIDGLVQSFSVGAGLSVVAVVWLLAAFRDPSASAEIERRSAPLPPTQTPGGEV